MHDSNRPRFLTLWQIRLPITGVVSLLHRISGIVMLILFPFMLYLLQLSLRSAEDFARARTLLESRLVVALGLLLLWLFAHHLFAGVRVLLIDLDWGAELAIARRSAYWVLIAALLVVLGGALL